MSARSEGSTEGRVTTLALTDVRALVRPADRSRHGFYPQLVTSRMEVNRSSVVIGSIRRECLDYVVVIGERHLRAILSKYVDYYNRTRTHLALTKDTPEHRTVQSPSQGRVVEVSRVGELHHEYMRQAA